MSEARAPLRRVIVAGAGQIGVLAAIALKRALPRAEVVVVGLPRDPGALADRAATALPFTSGLHDRLGIDENDILVRAQGSHRLVTRFFGWGGPQQSGAMPYGVGQLDPSVRSRFATEWGGGAPRAAVGEAPASLADALAAAGRFGQSGEGDTAPPPGVEYALRWHPDAYRALLVEAAMTAGVEHVEGRLAGIEPDAAGGIAALILAGGQRLAGDLFVDCSGPSAHLLVALPGSAIEDWSTELPLRRLILGRPGPAILALEDRLHLLPEGWRCEMAGRDGLHRMLGVGEGVTEDQALRTLGAPPLAGFTLEPGCAREAWLGNVVALGDAAARFEPLGHLNLDLAHRQLDLLLELLPGCEIEPLERAEYNRRAALMMVGVRDTLAAHYAAPAARRVFGPPLLPPALAVAIDQFERRGRIPFREEGPLLSQEFQALLAALGFARGASPQSLGLADGERAAAEAAFRSRIEAALSAAPPYAEWMAGVVSRARPG